MILCSLFITCFQTNSPSPPVYIDNADRYDVEPDMPQEEQVIIALVSSLGSLCMRNTQNIPKSMKCVNDLLGEISYFGLCLSKCLETHQTYRVGVCILDGAALCYVT